MMPDTGIFLSRCWYGLPSPKQSGWVSWSSVQTPKLYILYNKCIMLSSDLRPQTLPRPFFLHVLYLEVSFQHPFSLPARRRHHFLCALLLKPGTLSRFGFAGCLSWVCNSISRAKASRDGQLVVQLWLLIYSK